MTTRDYKINYPKIDMDDMDSKGIKSQRDDYIEGSYCLKERNQQSSPAKHYWKNSYQR